MRVMVLGGTRFIGRAIVEALVAGRHEVVVVHRGTQEPHGWVDVEHVHRSRDALTAADVAALRPEVFVDTYALNRRDAELAVAVLPDDTRALVLSSVDVYAAYGDLLAGRATQPVPLYEDSPVRHERYPYRGRGADLDDYDKLDVEDIYRARGATICRLPVVVGRHDPQRREAFVLDRIRAGREAIPFGAGGWLSSFVHVADVAEAVVAAVELEQAAGETLNIGPSRSLTVRQWAKEIISASGGSVRLRQVPDDHLPPDLQVTGAIGQHLLCDASKARSMLGWRDRPPAQAVADSVAWHLAHESEINRDWSADDAALAAAPDGSSA